MHSAGTNSRTKAGLNISDVGPRFASMIRAVGIRCALPLAVFSALLVIAVSPARAQTETALYNFCQNGGYCTDGSQPQASLTSDGKGNLYGTTLGGGESDGYGAGTVFELSPNGNGGWNETVLYGFTGAADGGSPDFSNVIFDSAGNLYGTTLVGGYYGNGVVFELSPAGAGWTETVLHSFAGGANDGAWPENGLVMDGAGNLYGTTNYGGSGNTGTVFELSPSGGSWTEQVIYSFNGTYGISGLTTDAAGDIFGITSYLDQSKDETVSTVYELSTNGHGGWTPTVIYTFDAAQALGTPVVDHAGNLFGTTLYGGARNHGTVYKLSPGENGRTEEILHSFQGGKDGSQPAAGIVFDPDGNIYGTTLAGGKPAVGKRNSGTVFELVAPVLKQSKYKEKILWTFNGSEGSYPQDSLIVDGAGNLYGTTTVGGSHGQGVVFEVTPPACWTTTKLTSSPNPSAYAQAATFTAVVTCSLGAPPNGEAVTFMEGAKVLGTGSLSSGSATFTTSTLPVGTDSITAAYAGDAKFGGSTSNAVKQVVEETE